ncbi:unnamed protein product [Lymnaea stagnalis]|uniref:MOCS2A n=1 Tax=Lymnaea stagnalis TaxID=6523 RepID=A0AAV2HDI6_LYMST
MYIYIYIYTSKVTLLFFAKSREIIGHKEARLHIPSASTGRHILKYIVKAYPELNLIANNLVLSLNEEYLELDRQVTLQENDEIAVIPPISGG